MFTLYSMAARGEANIPILTDDSYVKPYWDGAKLMFQHLAAFGDPAIVHFEPNWWAYAQQKAADSAAQAVHVTTLAPDCASLPDNMIGMGKCLVLLARTYAPKAVIGFDASAWAAPNVGTVVDYLVKIGADGVGKPLLWRQMPFGVPSTSPGGAAGHYRDDRVKDLFDHPDEFVAAGGLGAVFGVGAGNQTYITTDGDQSKNAVSRCLAAPTPLP
jgi:hypothetical protein